MKLLHFLADLTRDPRRQEDYTRDPAMAMSEAGLSDVEQEFFLARDPAPLIAAIGAEISRGIITRSPTPWPGNGRPTFESISPGTGQRGMTVSATTKLAVELHDGAGASNGSKGLAGLSPGMLESVLKHGTFEIHGKIQRAREPIAGDPHALVIASYDIPSDAPVGAYRVVTTYKIGQTTGSGVKVLSPKSAFHVT
jgi:hypothetical protein